MKIWLLLFSLVLLMLLGGLLGADVEVFDCQKPGKTSSTVFLNFKNRLSLDSIILFYLFLDSVCTLFDFSQATVSNTVLDWDCQGIDVQVSFLLDVGE